MEPFHSVRPILAVVISLIAVPLIVATKRPNLRETWTLLAAAGKFLMVLSMVPTVLAGMTPSFRLWDVLPGLSISFRADPLGILFALVASFLWIVTSLYSIGYMRGLSEHSQTRYYAYFALALSSTIGVAFSANLLTLYLFYELLSFATYPLVTHHQDEEARSSGRKYLAYIVGGSIALFLPAMVITYNLSGTLDFHSGGIFTNKLSSEMAWLLLVLFMFGIAKAAIMPFHSWLPAAMVAPTPVSALLHAVAVVKVGVFSIVRILMGIFGLELITGSVNGDFVLIAASVTILLGSLFALYQDELKRLLAFSTIAQLSYIILGIGLASQKGMTGGLIHLVMHAFGKITLFFCAGAIYVSTGIRHISAMAGIGRRMPITMGAFFLGSLSVIGMPPCGGFLSKWYLALGALEAKKIWILVVLLVSSLLNSAYFIPIVTRAFFMREESPAEMRGKPEAPLCCLVPIVITGLISVLLLFFPETLIKLVSMAIHGLEVH
jgi:multicomponent Na+:H+ antiporter subunit D